MCVCVCVCVCLFWSCFSWVLFCVKCPTFNKEHLASDKENGVIGNNPQPVCQPPILFVPSTGRHTSCQHGAMTWRHLSFHLTCRFSPYWSLITELRSLFEKGIVNRVNPVSHTHTHTHTHTHPFIYSHAKSESDHQNVVPYAFLEKFTIKETVFKAVCYFLTERYCTSLFITTRRRTDLFILFKQSNTFFTKTSNYY